MRTIQTGSTTPIIFLLVDETDHISGLTGASPTVTISKAGAAFAAPAGTVAEVGSGWYSLTPTAADTGTLGPLALHATATGADPVDLEAQVVAYDPADAAALGLSRIDATIASRSSHSAPDLTNLDTTVSSRSSHSAADVWTATTRTLSSFGTLIADIRTNLLDLFKAIMRKDATAPLDVGGAYDPSTDSQEAIRDRGDAAWVTGGGGSGTADWTSAEREQIRHRIGIDGTATAPSTATPSLSTLSAGDILTTPGQPIATDASGNVSLDATVYTPAEIETAAAAGVLNNPANKLATDASGQTTAGNMRGTDNAMLASSYTAPDNAGISAIQAQTDKIGFTETSAGSGVWEVNVNLDAFDTLTSTEIETAVGNKLTSFVIAELTAADIDAGLTTLPQMLSGLAHRFNLHGNKVELSTTGDTLTLYNSADAAIGVQVATESGGVQTMGAIA